MLMKRYRFKNNNLKLTVTKEFTDRDGLSRAQKLILCRYFVSISYNAAVNKIYKSIMNSALNDN